MKDLVAELALLFHHPEDARRLRPNTLCLDDHIGAAMSSFLHQARPANHTPHPAIEIYS
jgi:hypothetical protein